MKHLQNMYDYFGHSQLNRSFMGDAIRENKLKIEKENKLATSV